MSKTKYICGTLNNWTEDEYTNLISTGASDRVSYIVVGKEGVNATPHLQYYVEFTIRTTYTKAKSILGSRSHLEGRRGSAKQAADYCKKEDDWTEQGEISKDKSGTRTDLEELQVSMQSGMQVEELSDEHFGSFIRYRRGIMAYYSLHATPRSWKTRVIVYWGETGSGKTRRVYDEALTVPYTHPGGPWFDGYRGQQTALFDDFGGSEFKLTYLLKLIDRYPMKVPVKGDFVEWAPKVIYITSNLNPENWFPNAHREHVAAMFRRFDMVEEVNN